jgi:hypothetical protein
MHKKMQIIRKKALGFMVFFERIYIGTPIYIAYLTHI